MKKVKHFLHISDYGSEELWDILNLSKEVKANSGIERIILHSRINLWQ